MALVYKVFLKKKKTDSKVDIIQQAWYSNSCPGKAAMKPPTFGIPLISSMAGWIRRSRTYIVFFSSLHLSHVRQISLQELRRSPAWSSRPGLLLQE